MKKKAGFGKKPASAIEQGFHGLHQTKLNCATHDVFYELT